MHINGVLHITGTFKGKSKIMDCLVSDDLQDEIIVAGIDAADVGAVLISPDEEEAEDDTQDPNRCNVLRPETSPCKKVSDFTKSIVKRYPCISDKLSSKPMTGFPDMVINLKEGFVPPEPVQIAAKIPHHFQAASNDTMDDLIEKGIIRVVGFSNKAKFRSRALMVAKPGGIKNGARLVVDQSPINKGVVRPTHPFTSGNELLKMVPHTARVFAKFDALSGYFQIPLAEESRYITQFIHPRGTFEFCRAPMGLNASGDEWCKRSDTALANIEGVLKLVDDILIFAENYDLLFQRIEAVLDRCMTHNITLSKKKMEIGESVTFAGFHVSKDGYSPTKERTDAIKEFPTPKNVTGIRAFLGMANGLAHFVPDYAQASDPLRNLLKKAVVWRWGERQENAFNKVKEILTGKLVLKNFDPNRETHVITDASRVGTGFCLLQRYKNEFGSEDDWFMVQCGSKALNGAESRYAVCEIEGLAILHALRRCRHYLAGMEHFTIITDHKSLEGVFRKDLSQIENVRLRRFRENLGEFNFTVKWMAGKFNVIADCLSRYPVSPADAPEDSTGRDLPESTVCVCKVLRDSDTGKKKKKNKDPLLEPMLTAAKLDSEYQEMLKGVRETIRIKDLHDPKQGKTHPVGKIAQVWDDVSIHAVGLLVVDSQRIIVPENYRQTIVEKLHTSHCGQSKSQWRARRDYWWPGYNKSIEERVRQCPECLRFRASQQIQPIINQNESKAPMEVVGVDLFKVDGEDFIAMVDQFSGFPWAKKMSSTTTSAVIGYLKSVFNSFGNPEQIMCDQGPQFKSTEFGDFLKERGILCTHSTAYHPRSNGLSEACVKNVERLYQKANKNMEKFDESLQAFRDTPANKNCVSPAEIFLCRRMRTNLPSLVETTLNVQIAEMGAQDKKDANAHQFGKRSTQDLSPLNIGDLVITQEPVGKKQGEWLKQGFIMGVKEGRGDSETRSYMVNIIGGGSRYINRKDLILLTRASEKTAPSAPDVSLNEEEEPAEAESENTAAESVDPDSDHEDQLSIPDTAIENIPEPAPEVPVPVAEAALPRRSARQATKKDCQSCVGCTKIECSHPEFFDCTFPPLPPPKNPEFLQSLQHGKPTAQAENRNQPTRSPSQS